MVSNSHSKETFVVGENGLLQFDDAGVVFVLLVSLD
jgi:hypothetical protein